MIGLIGYLCGVVFVALITYSVCDPYGHFRGDPWYKAKFAAKASIFWPFWLVYVIYLLWWKEGDDK